MFFSPEGDPVNSGPYPFLTDAWIEAAQALQAEFSEQLEPEDLPDNAPAVIINVVITGSPHHQGPVHGHIDTRSGALVIEWGHLDDANLRLTIDYATAQTLFLDRDPQAVMTAFFGGKILAEGDVASLLAVQAQRPSERAIELYRRLDALTDRDNDEPEPN